MDLRVYVDGVARIICDLTRTTTVHDIIIALAQYKGQAGRYSLIQQTPDGTQRTLSPHELTSELIHHPDWAYILKQNPSNQSRTNGPKRSKSLDGRKTPTQKSIVEMPNSVTSSVDHFRTVQHKHHHHPVVATLSPANKKRSNLHQIFPSINTSKNQTEVSSPSSYKRPSRLRIPTLVASQQSRPKSAGPASPSETNAFHMVHNPLHSHVTNPQQYIALLQILKSQEIEIEQQQRELKEKEKEIDYREAILYQTEIYQNKLQHELERVEEHDRRLFAENQTIAQEYSSEKLEIELKYQETLHLNYEHLQQQIAHCSATLEQKQQLQEQLQCSIVQVHEETEDLQTTINSDKKEITQCKHDLDRSNSPLRQLEDLFNILAQRNEDLERTIQERGKQITEFENELIRLDDLLIHNVANSSYHFHPTPSAPDVLTPVNLQFMNSTLLKLCPSGIWV